MYETPFKAIIQHPKFIKIFSMILSHATLYSENYIYENLKFLNTYLSAENSKENNRYLGNNKRKNNIYHHKIIYGKYFSRDEIANNDVFQLNFNTVNRFDDRLFIELKMRDDIGRFINEEIIGQYDKDRLEERQHGLELKQAKKNGLIQGIEQGIEQGIIQGKKNLE